MLPRDPSALPELYWDLRLIGDSAQAAHRTALIQVNKVRRAVELLPSTAAFPDA